jgi:hypothetical protein
MAPRRRALLAGGLAALIGPGACAAEAPRRLLSRHSPWNTPIPRGARYAEVPGLEGFGVGLTSWDEAWGSVGLHQATPRDPLVEIRWVPDTWMPVAEGRWKRFGNAPSVEAEILAASEESHPWPANPYSTQHAAIPYGGEGRLPRGPARSVLARRGGLRVRAPSAALPSPDSDGHAVLIQPDGMALELYSAIVLSAGVWVSSMYGFTDALNGLGVGEENGRRASLIPSYAGVLRHAELASGAVGHALNLVVPAGLLTTEFVPPALAFDTDPGYSGTLPMGARLALPPGTDLDGLGLRTRLGAVLAPVLRDHGAIVTDRGGGGISIVTEYAPASQPLAQRGEAEWQDLRLLFRRMRRVLPG